MVPDQIHPMILKECALEFAINLTKLFRLSIKQEKSLNHGDMQILALSSSKNIDPSSATND